VLNLTNQKGLVRFYVFLLQIFSVFKGFLADVTLLLLVDVGLVLDEAVTFAESPWTKIAGESSLILV
jgi:hypothetical protein